MCIEQDGRLVSMSRVSEGVGVGCRRRVSASVPPKGIKNTGRGQGGGGGGKGGGFDKFPC